MRLQRWPAVASARFEPWEDAVARVLEAPFFVEGGWISGEDTTTAGKSAILNAARVSCFAFALLAATDLPSKV